MWTDEDTRRVLAAVEHALPERYRFPVALGYFADALAEMVATVDEVDLGTVRAFDVLANLNTAPRARLRLVPDEDDAG